LVSPLLQAAGNNLRVFFSKTAVGTTVEKTLCLIQHCILRIHHGYNPFTLKMTIFDSMTPIRLLIHRHRLVIN